MTTDIVVYAVIPALNEAETLGDVLDTLRPHVDSVVVVDDGSTDETPEVASTHGAMMLAHDHNRGYDAALGNGIEQAAAQGADVAVTFDADGQHQSTDVERVVAPIANGEASLVVGRRPDRPRFAETVYAAYTSARIGVADPLSGFKAYDLEMYRDIGYFDRCNSIGTQLLLAAYNHGYRIAEVDIDIKERDDKPRFGNLSANVDILSALARVFAFDVRTTLRGD